MQIQNDNIINNIPKVKYFTLLFIIAVYKSNILIYIIQNKYFPFGLCIIFFLYIKLLFFIYLTKNLNKFIPKLFHIVSFLYLQYFILYNQLFHRLYLFPQYHLFFFSIIKANNFTIYIFFLFYRNLIGLFVLICLSK